MKTGPQQENNNVPLKEQFTQHISIYVTKQDRISQVQAFVKLLRIHIMTLSYIKKNIIFFVLETHWNSFHFYALIKNGGKVMAYICKQIRARKLAQQIRRNT